MPAVDDRPEMNEAYRAIRGLGFPYVTVAFVWIKLCRDRHTGGFKPTFGPGWHSASSCEFVLLGNAGKAEPLSAAPARRYE